MAAARWTIRCGVVIALAAGISAVGVEEAAAQAWGYGVQRLPRASGWLSAGASQVSDDGTVISGTIFAGPLGDPSSQRGGRWTIAGGTTDLGWIAGGTNTRSAQIAADGSGVVLIANAGASTLGARWSAPGPAVGLLPPAGWIQASFGGMAADGSFVVGGGRPSGGADRALKWVNLAAPEVLPLPAGYTSARAGSVAGNGHIYGNAHNGSGQRLVRWTAEGFEDLSPAPPGSGFAVTKVSNDGAAAVGASVTGPGGLQQRAWRWTASGGMTELAGLAGSTEQFAWSMSGDGSLAVGVSYFDSPSIENGVATVWGSDGVPTSLAAYLQGHGVSTAGWTLLYASGVSGDGSVIVGSAIGPDGGLDGFVAVVPGPGGVVVVGVGMLVVGWRRRKP